MKTLTFKSIGIEAFGPFKKITTIALGTNSNKPMLLIEGMNGCGKTTLLLSLQIALFGKKVFPKSEKKKYETLIRDLARKDVQTPPCLCAEFGFHDASGEHVYQITRTWDLKENFHEHTGIRYNGQSTSMTIEEWDEMVNTYLPAELADMFFFDGEKIEQMANPDRLPAILKKATEAFLGIHEIDALFQDTIAFERRAISRMKSENCHIDTDLTDFNKMQEEEKTLEQRIEAESIALGEKQNAYDIAVKQFDSFKAEADRQGLAMYEKSITLKSNYETISQELDQAKSKLVEAVSNQFLPLSRLSQLLQDLMDRHEKESMAGNVKVLIAHDSRLLESLYKALPLCKDVIDEIFSDEHKALGVDAVGESILARMPSNDALKERIDQAVQNRNLAQKVVHQLEQKLTNIQKAIDSIPPEEQVQLILQREKEQQTSVTKAKLELEFGKEKIAQLEFRLMRVRQHSNAVEERLRTSYKGNAKTQAALQASKRVRGVLTVYKDRLLAHKAKWLSQNITSHFKRLMRKQSLIDSVQIDPCSYEVTLFMQSGDALPMGRLSAGERQLLATAVLNSLIGERAVSIPVVVDTPLARLDKSHRSSLVNSFYATVSHQVIVFSTDEEIQGKLKVETSKYISRGYRLIYNDQKQCTSVEEMVL